ncbi:Uncharacterised protein r2_g1623 [Pycnogonum litorale]
MFPKKLCIESLSTTSVGDVVGKISKLPEVMEQHTERTCIGRFKCRRPGLWLALNTALFLTASLFLVSVKTKTFNSVQISLYNSILCGASLLIFNVLHPSQSLRVSEGERLYVAVHAISHAISNVTMFVALSFLPASEALTIDTTNTIFTAIIAWAWLGEKLNILDGFIILSLSCGLVLIIQPPYLFATGSQDDVSSWDRTVGSSFQFISTLTWSMTNCLNRKLQGTNVSLIEIYVYICIFVTALPATFIVPNVNFKQDAEEYAFILLISVCFLVGHASNVWSLQLEHSVPVSFIKNTQSIYLLILDAAFFHRIPNVTRAVGILIVLICVTIFSFTDKIICSVRRALDRSNCCKTSRIESTETEVVTLRLIQNG